VELNEHGEEGEDAGESSEGLSSNWLVGWVEGVADKRIWKKYEAEKKKTGRRNRLDLQAVKGESARWVEEVRERQGKRGSETKEGSLKNSDES
jgi:hypothetical protein